MYWFYEILNRKNGLRYIGLTSNIIRREIRHFTDLKTGRHHNSFLQKDFDNQSVDDFICILKQKTYQDFFYTYKTKTKEEKDKMASFLREKEEQTSRIAGTSLRSTNHNISEKKI